ncbi:MAG: NifB/NifX family molybdenum-iron cluster-binding protein [Hyphomicrobiales bacterium]
MKILITSTGNSVDSVFDLRFGRAEWYCIYDVENASTEFFNNESKNQQEGAGIKAAEQAAVFSVEKVISGDFGPKAKDLLNKFSIQMVVLQEQGITIKEIINKL